jgi:hypothetical protein
MEEVGHVVLFLSSSTFAKALDEEDGLEHPQIWLCREASISKDLGADVVVYANLYSCKLTLTKQKAALTAN